MSNKQATEAPERLWLSDERKIGGGGGVFANEPPFDDPYTHEYVRADIAEAARQAGIDEGLEAAAKFIEENKVCQMGNFRPIRPMKSGELISVKQIEYATAIRALKSEEENG